MQEAFLGNSCNYNGYCLLFCYNNILMNFLKKVSNQFLYYLISFQKNENY